MKIIDFQRRVSEWSGPDLEKNSSQLIHHSKVILYQDFKRSSLLMYLFDNQLVFCSSLTSSDLKGTCDSLVFFRRFDLAFLNFKIENNNFIFKNLKSGLAADDRSVDSRSTPPSPNLNYNRPLPALPTGDDDDEVEIHVKGRNSRQEWRYLLSLEIGFAKIKYKHRKAKCSENETNPPTQETLAEDICNFIRKLKH